MAAETDLRSQWATLREMARYLWPAERKSLRVRVVASIIFLVSAKLLNVYVPYLYKYIVDNLSGENGPLMLPVFLIIAYGGARLGQQIFAELRDLVFVRVARYSQRVIALSTFRHMHSLSLAYHLNRNTGGISRIIERGVRGVHFLLSFMTFNILPTLFEIILVAIILFVEFDYRFSLIVTGTIIIYILFTLLITEWRIRFRKNMNESDTRANSRAIDSLLNYETVKYFNNEEHEYRRYNDSMVDYEEAAVKSQKSLAVLNAGQSLLITGGLTASMLLAAEEVSHERMTIGGFVMINTYLIQLYLPLNFLGFVYREIKNSLVDMQKMFEVRRKNPDVADKTDTELEVKAGVVEFKNVSFAYDSRRQILKNISFTINAGEKVAVVGETGAGKSTLSRLLYRFYDVDSGSIEIDGCDIRDVSQLSLRRSIGIVPQDTVLFNDSIRYNIAYGDLGAEEKQIEKAAAAASINRFIASLPDGYETMVGERGLKLSGGEKQRIAIARLVLKDVPVLIFDEATSALDTHTEKKIQQALKKVSRRKTTLIIAHRLSTITDADLILVMKNGRIRERGSHARLMKKKGEYYRMYMKQQHEEG